LTKSFLIHQNNPEDPMKKVLSVSIGIILMGILSSCSSPTSLNSAEFDKLLDVGHWMLKTAPVLQIKADSMDTTAQTSPTITQ